MKLGLSIVILKLSKQILSKKKFTRKKNYDVMKNNVFQQICHHYYIGLESENLLKWNTENFVTKYC